MSKRNDRRRAAQLLASVVGIEVQQGAADSEQISNTTEDLTQLLLPGSKRELTRMKKFRFQLLHEYIVGHISPCRVADIGGGKGLIAYLLQQSGWQATVIDPIHQALPTKYKDLLTDKQVQIDPSAVVTRLDCMFAPELARDYDLLVALHAHGCNIMIIDAALQYHRKVILLPCCIIDEPLIPAAGIHWLQCVADYAKTRGFTVEPFQLNFKGQNIGLYMIPACGNHICSVLSE